MAHSPPPSKAERFAVLIMRPAHRDGHGINRAGTDPLRAALACHGMASAVLDMSEATAVQQLVKWLETGRVALVHGQGGWGSEVWTRSGMRDRSIFDHFDIPFLARIAVPPFSASVSHAMTARIARGTILLGDGDALTLARKIAPEPVSVIHYPSVFAGFTNEPAPARSASSPGTGLVVMALEAPDRVRERWRELFPGDARYLDALAERAEAAPNRPFAEIVLEAIEESGFEPLERGGDAFVMLNLVNKFLAARRKRQLLCRSAGFPFRFVIDGDLSGIVFHDRAEISGPVPATALFEIYGGAKAAISCNPANMTGAVSERIPMALRAGAAVVHARNTALSEMFEPGRDFIEFSPIDEDIDRVCDLVASGVSLAAMRERFNHAFERRLGPDVMAARLLALAGVDTG